MRVLGFARDEVDPGDGIIGRDDGKGGLVGQVAADGLEVCEFVGFRGCVNN